MDDHRKAYSNRMDKGSFKNPKIERRTYTRKKYFVPVDYATQDRAYSEFIHDISINGMFIETRHKISPGQEITLTFSLPGCSSNIKVIGKVVRTDSSGIGVTFIPIEETQKALISECIEEI